MPHGAELPTILPPIGAILLAAGSASRMGCRPKCLLELDGVPLIRRLIVALFAAGVKEVVVVLGHYADRISLALQDLPVRIVRNPHPDEGHASSLRQGLRSLPGALQSVMVALADQPLVQVSDISDLIARFHNRPLGVQVVQPQWGDAIGNPVMFTNDVRNQILAGPSDFGCRQWQLANPTHVDRWVSDNQRYYVDVDTAQDIQSFEILYGLPLNWPSDLA